MLFGAYKVSVDRKSHLGETVPFLLTHWCPSSENALDSGVMPVINW